MGKARIGKNASDKTGQRKTSRFPDTKPKVLVVIGISYLFLLCLLLQPVLAESPSWPPEQPIPRIESGMHTAPIWRISVDAQERFLVTASKDKTARVWDLANGELLKILRVPMGEGPFEGQLHCVAISPDGAKVAVAGYTGIKRLNKFNIYIFDRENGRLINPVIRDLPAEIGHLTFSRDGQYLAATLVGEQGLRVYNCNNWSEVCKDKSYTYDSYGADFGPSPQNHLITTSYDGSLRLYKLHDGKFERILTKRLKKGSKPGTARFSPDGSLLAVGFIDSHRVEVFSGETLTFLYEPKTKGTGKGHLARVAWSRKGNLLYAGGGVAEAGVYQVLRWTQAGQGSVTRFRASFNAIMDLYPLEDGRLVFGAADPAFGILDPSGRRVLAKFPNTPDFRNKQKDFRISADGSVVEFGFALQDLDLTQKHYLARLDTKTRQFTLLDPPSKPMDKELRPPDTTGFKDSDWENTKPHTNPKFRGIYDPQTKSYSLARIPKGRGFILGTDWELLFFAENGKPLFYEGKHYEPEGKVIFLPGSAHCLNVSGDGKVAVAALGDGSLRWYRLDDDKEYGKEILAFLRHRDGRWVMWSPEGFFTCSPDGGKLFGYHLNQGPDKTPRFVTSDQLYDQFYRRDLVSWRLEGRLEKEVKTALSQGDVRQVLAAGPPPTVEILGPREVHHKGQDFTLRLKLTDLDGGIGNIIYQVNGITLEPRKSREIDPFEISGVRDASIGLQEASIRVVETQWPVILARGKKSIITVVAKNTRGVESTPATLIVHSDEPKPKDLPTLYGLVVGTSYSHITPKLQYAVKDALDLKAELEKRSRGLFKEIKIKPLVDQGVTLTGIAAAFKELASQVKPEDAFVLFLAGHGKNLDGHYYFLPDDLRTTDDQALRAGGLDQARLQALLGRIPAEKSLILLDTCYSGTFASLPPSEGQKNALDHVNRQLGCRAIMCSASDKQVALEGYEGHGLFTHALLQGLRGYARKFYYKQDDEIDVKELFATVEALVPGIAEKEWHIRQTPMSSDIRFVNFKIAKVN